MKLKYLFILGGVLGLLGCTSDIVEYGPPSYAVYNVGYTEPYYGYGNVYYGYPYARYGYATPYYRPYYYQRGYGYYGHRPMYGGVHRFSGHGYRMHR